MKYAIIGIICLIAGAVIMDFINKKFAAAHKVAKYGGLFEHKP